MTEKNPWEDVGEIAELTEDWPPVGPLAKQYGVNHYTMKNLMEVFYNAEIIR